MWRTLLKYIGIALLTALFEGLIVGIYLATHQTNSSIKTEIVGWSLYALIMHIWFYPLPIFFFLTLYKSAQQTMKFLDNQVYGMGLFSAVTAVLFNPLVSRSLLTTALLFFLVGAFWGLLHWLLITRLAQSEQ